MADSDNITAREFQNFREDTKTEFCEVHGCTKRIEEKIDDLTKKINPIVAAMQEKREVTKKRWDMKMIIFGSCVGVGFSVVTTGILLILGWGH